MALIDCPKCSKQISDGAANCPFCGYPVDKLPPVTDSQSGSGTSTAADGDAPAAAARKSRVIYIILGILFGAVGLHNIYARQYRLGGIKFGLILCTVMIDATMYFYTGFWMFVLAFCVLWAWLEVIFVKTDGNGNRMS